MSLIDVLILILVTLGVGLVIAIWRYVKSVRDRRWFERFMRRADWPRDFDYEDSHPAIWGRRGRQWPR